MKLSIHGTLHVSGFDWGPMVTHLIIDMGTPLSPSLPLKKILGVVIHKDHHSEVAPIRRIFLVDENGMSTTKASSWVKIEFQIHPSNWILSPFRWNGDLEKNQWAKPYRFSLHLNHSFNLGTTKITSFGWAKPLSMEFHGIENVTFHSFPNPQKPKLQYALFSPSKTGSKHPLIIWLHGAGEGGKDPLIALYGNRVTQLFTKEIQSLFGGAYVLIPQTSTIWMDDGSGDYTTTGYSKYVKSLESLIESVIEHLEDIDSDRIYIGGCSNGGYMTLKMILETPERYAAAFPICEAYMTSWLTKKEINTLATIPSWYVVTKNDPIVDPKTHAKALIKKLKLLNSSTKFTQLPRVVDQSGIGLYGGKAVVLHPHWSWVPVLNNQVTTDEEEQSISLFSWLSKNKKTST